MFPVADSPSTVNDTTWTHDDISDTFVYVTGLGLPDSKPGVAAKRDRPLKLLCLSRVRLKGRLRQFPRQRLCHV
jgi:hypothetical protein